MSFFRLRLQLRAIRSAIEELRDAIQEHSRAIHATEERERYEQSVRKTVNVILTFDDKAVRSAKEENERQYHTQNSIKKAAWCAFVAATVYAGIAAYQANEMRKTTAAAQQSANIAAAQLEATDRPWIKAVPQGWSPVTFDKGNLSFSVTFALTNVGHSVATDVTIYPGALVPTWEGRKHFEEPIERQTELCKKSQSAGLTFSLFPDETKQLNVGITIGPEEMEKNIVPPPPGMPKPEVPPGKRIDPILFGCVDYRFASLPKHHQTGFIYSIVRTDLKTPNVSYFVIIGMNSPPNHVNLERWMFGGDYAN